MPIFDASERYRDGGTPLLVLAGKDYGSGSSRDWAAKGPLLLGVKAVLAESFERIHRSNLVGLGVLPLCFPAGESAGSLGLRGDEVFTIELSTPGADLEPKGCCTVHVEREGEAPWSFEADHRLDTKMEVEYYCHGGVLPYVMRQLATSAGGARG